MWGSLGGGGVRWEHALLGGTVKEAPGRPGRCTSGLLT